jgi:hypothetical protein
MSITGLDGNTTSIAFGTSAFAGKVIGLDPSTGSRDPVEGSHLGTVKSMEFFPANLVDNGEVSLEVEFDPAVKSLIGEVSSVNAVTENIIITWPLKSTESVAGTTAFDAFITAMPKGSAANGERMVYTMTLKITGDITDTAGSV